MNKLLSFFTTISVCLILTITFTEKSIAQQTGLGSTYIDTALFNDMEFRAVGPTRGGRVPAVSGIIGAPSSFYMGVGPAGGVWRTDNNGYSWRNLTDGKGLKSNSIGALAVATSDTSTIYVGTGTVNLRDNSLTGRGVYKSTDSGKTWEYLGLEETGAIGEIKIHPHDANRVYVAALGHPYGPNSERGVFRTKNGGESWEKVLFASDSTGAVDLELNPENPDIIYAALWRGERKPWEIISGAATENGLYKSTDGGDTWKELTKGIPAGLKGRAGLAVSPANPDRVYALLEAPGDKQGLYRSEDSGENWTQVSDTAGIMA